MTDSNGGSVLLAAHDLQDANVREVSGLGDGSQRLDGMVRRDTAVSCLTPDPKGWGR